MTSFLGYGSPEALEEAIKKSKGEQSKDFIIYDDGLVSASVCSSLPQEEVEKRMKRVITGVTGGWRFANDGNFSSGEANPCPCNQQPKTHKHYLFHC